MKQAAVTGLAIVVMLLPALGRPARAQALGQGETFYDIIKNDHKVITDDFKKVFNAIDNDAKKQAFDNLTRDLFTHMDAEENYWYPVLQGTDQGQGLALQAKDEHLAARTEIKKIAVDWNTEPPRLELAEKMINEHVSFEESKMFDTSRQVIGSAEEKKITQEFKAADK
jgi:hemerythrin superfamily protein